jgi:hypothetical protein
MTIQKCIIGAKNAKKAQKMLENKEIKLQND